MKRGTIMSRIADPATLTEAWKLVRGKGAGGGFDRVTVQEFAENADARLEALRIDLVEERYAPEPLHQISVAKHAGAPERRVLRLPSVRDKVAQQAVRLVIEPRLDRMFLDCSFGYRAGKGPQRAVSRVTHYIVHKKRRWAATADINDFFGSIDHEALLHQLRGLLRDESVLRLIELWLKMGAVDSASRWRDVQSGVNQGAVISPLLANLYMHPFDQSLTNQGLALVRYADDFVILCAERSEAERALARAASFLRDRLKLRLNENPRPVVSAADGFAFLGIFFQGTERKLDADKAERIGRRIRELTDGPAAGADFRRALRGLNQAVMGWRRYYAGVLRPSELVGIETPLREGLTRLVAKHFRTGTFKTLADAATALRGVELIGDFDLKTRRQYIEDLACEGRKLSKAGERSDGSKPAAAGPSQAARAAGPAAEPRRMAPGTTLEQTPNDGNAVSGRGRVPGVPARVRGRKRRHYQQAAYISELVVDTPGNFIGKQGDRVVVRQQRQIICQVPLGRLTAITVATHGISLSSDVVAQCAARGIPILFVSPPEKLTAVVSAPESRDAHAGVRQLAAVADEAPALDLARRFAEGKVRNQLKLMKYLHKYHGRRYEAVAKAFATYDVTVTGLLAELKALTLDGGGLATVRNRIMSIEGRAAAGYWDVVRMVLARHIEFNGRERRGAKDPVNMLLNYGYAILQSRVHLAVVKAGLSPQVSFLHAPRRSEPTLVFDLMEEFRPHVVDRTVITLLCQRMSVELEGEGRLALGTRRRLIEGVHLRLNTLVRFRGRELKLAEIIQHQAKLLVQHLEGKKTYRAYAGRW